MTSDHPWHCIHHHCNYGAKARLLTLSFNSVSSQGRIRPFVLFPSRSPAPSRVLTQKRHSRNTWRSNKLTQPLTHALNWRKRGPAGAEGDRRGVLIPALPRAPPVPLNKAFPPSSPLPSFRKWSVGLDLPCHVRLTLRGIPPRTRGPGHLNWPHPCSMFSLGFAEVWVYGKGPGKKGEKGS